MTTATRPNIVLIHCHDLGRWLSCYDAPSVPSPGLAAFARESIVFERAFSAAPLCSPARGALFTGRSPHSHGVLGLTHHGWRYREDVLTLPELLAPLGYDTALAGLQHENADANVLGFGEVVGSGFLPRAWPVVEAATEWLSTRREAGIDRPFFLTVGIWEAHRPWPVPDYEPADPTTVEVPPYLPDNEHTRADIAAFYGAIRQLDAAVSHLLKAIETETDPDRTMVVFTTDHGAAFPGAKGTLYDPGVEVAMLVRPLRAWGVPPGRCPEVVGHVDLVPTFLELAAGTPDATLEGASLLPLICPQWSNGSATAEKAGAPNEDRLVFLEKNYHDAYDPIRAVRSRRYKYIRNFSTGPALLLSHDLEHSESRQGIGDEHLRPRPAEELYDLTTDPWERTNLVGHPDHEQAREYLIARLHDWMRRTADPLLAGPIPPPPPRSRAVDALPALSEPERMCDVVPGHRS